MWSRPSWNDRTFWRTRRTRVRKRRVGGLVGCRQLLVADAHVFGVQADLVELLGVVQDGLQALGAHVAANAFDDARRRQRFAEDLLGELPAARRDHVGLRAQLVAQGDQLLGRVGESWLIRRTFK